MRGLCLSHAASIHGFPVENRRISQSSDGFRHRWCSHDLGVAPELREAFSTRGSGQIRIHDAVD